MLEYKMRKWEWVGMGMTGWEWISSRDGNGMEMEITLMGVGGNGNEKHIPAHLYFGGDRESHQLKILTAFKIFE